LEKNRARQRKQSPELEASDVDVAALCKRERMSLCDNQLHLEGAPDEPWLRVDLGQLLRAVHYRNRGELFTVSAFYDPPSDLPDWEKGIGNMSATYAYGTQGVEVEVDTDTGDVTILGMVAVHDVGKVLHPQALAGQTYGALAQGLGYALYEEVLSEEGRILNPSFRDYKIPTVWEMGFPLKVEFVETDDETGPFGAKGVGEPGLVPTAPAIANAIYDAVGLRVRDLPITPEKLLAALIDYSSKSSCGATIPGRGQAGLGPRAQRRPSGAGEGEAACRRRRGGARSPAKKES
jgi:xanthine dehydrogenase molybdenum-binding subunit